MTRILLPALLTLTLAAAAVAPASAQSPLGTFSWRLAPYCNIIRVTVTPDGPYYRLVGDDDDCGAQRRMTFSGAATPNLDGTVSFGGVGIAPTGGVALVSALVNPSTLGGTWTDGDSAVGTLVPGASGPQPGPRRPVGGGSGASALAEEVARLRSLVDELVRRPRP